VQTVNIHEAKTHLSRLVERAAKGEAFVIAKAGRPLVKVVALTEGSAASRKRIGFMPSNMLVPADFDTMGREQIGAAFAGEAAP
jgi:prevent-host-death family protein